MINWKAMQSYKGVENAEASIYNMTMASWHADAHHNGERRDSKRGGGKPKARCKIKMLRPPVGGWS